MLGGKEVYRSIEINDNVNLASLSISDLLRVIFARLSNDDVAELDAQTKLSVSKLEKTAALTKLLDKATQGLQITKQNSVTIEIASEFIPYLDEVVDNVLNLRRYYDVKMESKCSGMSAPHRVIMVISKK